MAIVMIHMMMMMMMMMMMEVMMIMEVMMMMMMIDDDDISLLSFRIRKTRAGCDGALSLSRDVLSLFHRSQGRRKVRGWIDG